MEGSPSSPGVDTVPRARSEPRAITAAPRASVIVCAHDRREYLREAVESVLAQDVERACYEIVVVKNFDDPQIDGFLVNAGVRIVRCNERTMSRKVIAGLAVAKSDVIFLLDDDDLFEPSKIRIALARFETDPALGFYHNRLRYVDARGDPLSDKNIRPLGLRNSNRSRPFYLDRNEKLRELHRLAYSYADFNHSCAVFRRELLDGVFPYLDRLEGSLDTFLFFVALMSPLSMLNDATILTRYRVHESNTSQPNKGDPLANRSRLLSNAELHQRSYSVIREMVSHSNRPELVPQIDGRLLVNRTSQVFRNTRSHRLDGVRVLLGAIRLRNTYPVRENISSWAGAFLFSLSPRIARRVYDHQLFS